MKRSFAVLWVLVAAILAIPVPAGAETRTVSWSAVATYTDGTPFAAGTTVTYNFFWTSDPGLSATSLRSIASSVPQTSATFDPDAKGMPRGETVYFTGQVLLSTGEMSALSPSYAWTVPIVTATPTLSSLSISGPSSVNEGGSGTYTATASWSDGSTTSVSPAWSENSAYASISGGGVLTTLAVTSNQTATVSASYAAGGVTRTASRSVTIVNVAATLSSLSISGPSSVNEGGSGTYTATASWSDGSTTSVSPTWGENSTYASISGGGVLTTLAVTSNQTATVTASYAAGGVTRTASKSVTIVNVAATLSSLSISGPSSVNESGSGTYTATAAWSDGSTTSVSPTWGVSPTTYASIGGVGVLTTLAVSSNQTATVTASYAAGGVTRTASKSVTIVEVPSGTLDPPKNVELTALVATSPERLFRLEWDPVTNFADGAPIPAGDVLYDAYWSTDPGLSEGTLTPLAPSTHGNSVDFDPVSLGMGRNQRVYLTTRASVPSGAKSPLSKGIGWNASNKGPSAPAKGGIKKQ
jgi:hypothetical protein